MIEHRAGVRRLRKDGKIVVLADGLEEALIGSSAEPERDMLVKDGGRALGFARVVGRRPLDPW